MKRLQKLKRAKKKKKSQQRSLVSSTQTWIAADNNLKAAGGAGATTTKTCRNSLCGRDFVVELAQDKDGVPVLCMSVETRENPSYNHSHLQQVREEGRRRRSLCQRQHQKREENANVPGRRRVMK